LNGEIQPRGAPEKEVHSGDVGSAEIESPQSASGETGVSRAQYRVLRRKSPNQVGRDFVNPDGVKLDPVYGYEVAKFDADHIVPLLEVVQFEGFETLSLSDQIEILNLRENFMGLGKPSNTSKGAKSWAEWQGHSRLGKIPDEIRGKMIKRDRAARDAIRKAIDDKLRNSGR